MVTENSSSGFQTWKQSHLLNRNSANKNGFVMGISDDIERSRSFARTLRQSRENRWWTAKYNNAPRYFIVTFKRRGTIDIWQVYRELE